MKKTSSVKAKWKSTRLGKFSDTILSEPEVKIILDDNPQNHKEAGFNKGWSSRFATIFNFTKELGLIVFSNRIKGMFSFKTLRNGLFLWDLASACKKACCSNSGCISETKMLSSRTVTSIDSANNAEDLYQLIKSIREKYQYKPSWEVIIDTCENTIMKGKFKEFQPKSIMNEYPDDFIRKMRLLCFMAIDTKNSNLTG
jgi:hypothetical protein